MGFLFAIWALRIRCRLTGEWCLQTDAETIIAMTNHAYFNLNANIDGTTTVLDHLVTMPTATQVQETTGAPDYHLLATGKVKPVAPGSPWDFTKAKAVGKDIDKGDVTPVGGYGVCVLCRVCAAGGMSGWRVVRCGVPSRNPLTRGASRA